MSDSSTNIRKPVLLIAAGLLVFGGVAFIWQQQGKQEIPTAKVADSFSNLDLEELTASYQMLRYVVERGGDEHQRKFAIEWLDEQTRLKIPPKPDQETWLLSVIEKGGHPDWDIEAKLWIFNDAFAYLHLGNQHERLTAILQNLALKHPHITMRLYALQHIDIQRSVGNLTGPHADKTYEILEQLAKESDGKVAGSALVALTNWDGPKVPPSEKLVKLALQLAADTNRTVDVRITAIHAVGNGALELARTLATDLTQPVMIRKASIACIGKYGTESDTASLKQLAKENFRIAQAAEPALAAITNRIANP